jgi:hypothetical protein
MVRRVKYERGAQDVWQRAGDGMGAGPGNQRATLYHGTGPHQRGARCNCKCISCGLPLTAVNAAKTEFQKRPHFRHPEGAESREEMRSSISQPIVRNNIRALRDIGRAGGGCRPPRPRSGRDGAGFCAARARGWTKVVPAYAQAV